MPYSVRRLQDFSAVTALQPTGIDFEGHLRESSLTIGNPISLMLEIPKPFPNVYACFP